MRSDLLQVSQAYADLVVYVIAADDIAADTVVSQQIRDESS
jgi:hypothetical protein